jgi:UDP-3-O-[3-hydroxymyristoyl] glucosamine N-acyltransferase
MSDNRFFQVDGPFSLGDLARVAGAELAQPERAGELIHDVADLAEAELGEAAVFSDVRHASAFATCHASVVVTSPQLSIYPRNGSALLLADDPRLAFAHIGKLFYPRADPRAFIHPRASVAESASIGENTEIGCGAVIGENAQIGPRCRIGPNAVIGAGVVIGADTVIGANSCVSHALIGAKVTVAENVTIGGEGFGFVPGPKGPVRVFQVGRVIIGDQVEIGSNCAIDRGSLGDTVIGAMSALDNLVQIGHNVKLGTGCILAGQAGVAGSTRLGDFVMVGGAASISDHLSIGNGAKIAGKSGVMRDVAAGETVAGYPAVPVRQWHKQTAALAKLVTRVCRKS